MKFALVEGQRREPQAGLSGECPGCGSQMISKCGDIRIHHWAHRGTLLCDPWWENETEWHRQWKGHFPVDWQEIVHRDEHGEKHIADVKTDKEWVLEFQNSFISPEERQSREFFYKKMIWVVNGTRRQRDQKQFFDALKVEKALQGPIIGRFCSVQSAGGALLRDWSGSQSPIFFDFGQANVLWYLLPIRPEGKIFVLEFSRGALIQFHRDMSVAKDGFEGLLKEFSKLATDYALRRPPSTPMPGISMVRPMSFQQKVAQQSWERARGRRF